eukprot:CAMPEP_0175648514 /NCGR_PEP_ID=MMETSP0097-20121207/8369_1 /TAXON_ID=311494 /ORGANISM="Alexandrium monilatum, Strain CCMP3105" /LENGTH=74 /DNA_ID=CAMNT_0016954431 /DNA_START=191 /DNA_END=416 /DNA_ORIENTATION=-
MNMVNDFNMCMVPPASVSQRRAAAWNPPGAANLILTDDLELITQLGCVERRLLGGGKGSATQMPTAAPTWRDRD